MGTGPGFGRLMRAVRLFSLSAFLVVAAACSPGIRQAYDAAGHRTITHMSGNALRESGDLAEHTLELNAARVEEPEGSSYMLFAEARGPGWVGRGSLTLRIDGTPVTFAEPLPVKAEVACPAEAANLNLAAVGGNDCVYEETYWFPVSRTVLTRLARAGEVLVRLEGSNGTISRRFTRDNFQKFEEFVAAYVGG